MYLEIITPDKKVFEGEVKLIQLPGSKGGFEILKNHAPIISTLEKGSIKIQDMESLLFLKFFQKISIKNLQRRYHCLRKQVKK